MKNEKEMATNFYFKMTVVEDKMADPFFPKQEDEKRNGFKVVQRQQFVICFYPVSYHITSPNV